MALKRKCIEVPGIVHHGGMYPGAIPFGVCLGDLFFSAATYGQDSATGAYGDSLERQVVLSFSNTRELLRRAGGTLSDIGLMTVWAKQPDFLEGVDALWPEAFPLASDRPARASSVTELPPRIMMQTEIIGALGRTRSPVSVPGVSSEGLAPTAVSMGDLLFSSALRGIDPATGRLAGTAKEQLELVFRNIALVVAAAGGETDHIGRVDFQLRDSSSLELVDGLWVDSFPDPSNRPTCYQRVGWLPDGVFAEAQFIAVLGGRRQVVELPWLSAAPIPTAVRIGNLLFSTGIRGVDPASGALAESPSEQAVLAFENTRSIMEEAGSSTDTIGHMMLWTKDRSCRDAANSSWLTMFPVDADRPCRHAVTVDLPEGVFIETQVIAVL